MNISWFRSQPLSPLGLKPNLNFLRNHLTYRDDFLNLSFYAYKRSSSLEDTPLPQTPSPQRIKKTIKMNQTLIFSETIRPIEMISQT